MATDYQNNIEVIDDKILYYKLSISGMAQKNIIRFMKQYVKLNIKKIIAVRENKQTLFISWNIKCHNIIDKLIGLLQNEKYNIITMGKDMIQIQQIDSMEKVKNIIKEVVL